MRVNPFREGIFRSGPWVRRPPCFMLRRKKMERIDVKDAQKEVLLVRHPSDFRSYAPRRPRFGTGW